jgi:hypothetical protein
MKAEKLLAATPVETIGSSRFSLGDKVVIKCHDEGYSGQHGKIVAVFASGRCQVAVGPIAILNLPPEGMQHAISD